MEITTRSRKRKQPPPESLQGIFTRRRSELFVHRTRSGRGRADPAGCRNPTTLHLQLRRPASAARSPVRGQRRLLEPFMETPLASIKDLRTRRIFSPASNDADRSPEKTPKPSSSARSVDFPISPEFNQEERALDEAVERSILVGHMKIEGASNKEASCKHKDEIEIPTKVGADGFREEIIDEVPQDSSRRCNKPQQSHMEGGGEEKIEDDTQGILGGLDSSNEIWLHTTPSDRDILFKSTVRGDGADGSNVGYTPNGGIPSENGGSHGSQGAMNSTYKNRQVLAPCSRLKLFQTPNSLSYKRLLPFLADIAKDNASSLEICSHKRPHSVKSEKTVGERSASHLLAFQSSISDSSRGKADDMSHGQHHMDASVKTEKIVWERPDLPLANFESPAADVYKADIAFGKHRMRDFVKTETIVGESPDTRLLGFQSPGPNLVHDVDGLRNLVDDKSNENGPNALCAENSGGTSVDALCSPLSPLSKSQMEKSPGILGSMIEKLDDKQLYDSGGSVSEKLMESSCEDLQVPQASKPVEVGNDDALPDSSTDKCYLEECNIENTAENAFDNSIAASFALSTPDSCKGPVAQLDEDASTSFVKFDQGPFAASSMVKNGPICESLSVSSTCQEALSMECTDNVRDVSESCIKAEESATLSTLRANAESLESLDLQYQSDCLGYFGTPVGPTKGILKTHTQVCKGPCTCSDCALLRLHVEKSDEFSRKQMHSAEEVAVGLIQELSCLRNLLGGSLAACSANRTNQAVVQIYQIKGFCRRALKAEAAARDRLRQMNRDLNIHWRITALQRPKVRFADDLQERIPPHFEKDYK